MKINKKTKISDLLKKDPKMTVGDLFESRKKERSRGSKKADVAPDNERLKELKEEAFSKEMEGAKGFGRIGAFARGTEKVRELEQEYKTARTGVKSRYGNIAKAFGADPKTSAMLDKLFGKKVDDKELKKLREKFNLNEKGKPKKAEKEDKETEKKEAAQKDLIDKIDKIFDVLKEVRSVIEGVANKLRASPAKEAPKTKKEARKLEKQAGLKYSKETGRYHDVKTKKMVGFETARQKMNISPSSVKAAGVTSAAGLAAGVGAAAAPPTASKVMEGKADTFAAGGPKPATEEEVAEVGKDVKKVSGFVDDILDMFSMKKFYRLIGGAIGAVFPLLIKAGEWLWTNLISPGVDFAVNIAKQIGQWLGGIEIPEFKIPLVGSVGPFKPFGFLAGVKPAPTAAPAGATPAPAAEPTPPPGEGSSPPKPEGGGAAAPAPPAAGGSAPAGGGGATGGGGSSGGGGGSSGSGGGATGGGGAAPTATAEGSNMPGGSPPKKGGGGGGGQIPSGGYLGAAAEFIAKEEGLPKGGKAYWDPPGQNNLVSIGYGHQIKPEEYKQGFIQAGSDQVKIAGDRGIDTVLSKDQAKSLLAADLPKYEERAKKPLGEAWTKLADEQKAALISYAYNTGSTGSLVKQGLKDAALSGNDDAGAEIISERGVRTAGGKPFPPLVKRRRLEGALYAEGESAEAPAGGGGGESSPPAVASAAPPPTPATATPTSGAASSSASPEAAASPSPAVASASPPAPAAPAATPSEPTAPAVAAATPSPSVPSAAAPVATPAVAAATPPPSVPSATPTATPVEPTPTTGMAVAANTTEVTAAKEQMVADNTPAPQLSAPVIAQPSSKPPTPDNSVRASARLVEDTFTRALAKDFSHPSAFTTVSMI